ncbi:hypothetical protein NAV26_05900 [Pseudomonas stutzeri]|uniref:hypothetical protein n=1 Tax=Stutzerimonas stutzeri TaxID=316 RepID=UPI00210D15A8|nr:hypothetical protein [Stutzerimonas stutzeri]MCQ4324496.1 hypothetical protein [Stutzerimonas stutzeri]
MKDIVSGRAAIVWADGYSFREVEILCAEPVEVEEHASVLPLAEKVLTEARLATFLLGPLLVDLPQG